MTTPPHTQPQESPDHLRDALEASRDGVAVFDEHMHLLVCNQRYIDMFPLIADLIVPGTHWDTLLRSCVERGEILDPFGDPDAFMNRAINSRQRFDQDVVAEHADGTSYLVQFKPTSSGGCVVTRQEIAEDQQIKALIQDREALLATVLDASPVAVVMARLNDGGIIYRSEEARVMYGNTVRAQEHYLTNEDRAAYVAELIQSKRIDGYQTTCLRADGSSFQASVSGRIVDYDGEACVVSAITDLSEQLERDALIRNVVEACPTPIQMTEANSGEVLFSSPETLALFGNTTNARSLFVNPQDRARQIELLRKFGVVRDLNLELYTHSGEQFWASVSAQMIRYNGKDVIVSHTRDLTDQMQIESELNNQRDLIFQNEKMSALGELLAGVAHELNNPLSVVVGHSLMLREDTQDAGILHQVDKISAAAERCSRIVKTFLTMARQQPSISENININEIVCTAVDVARFGDLNHMVKVDNVLAPNLPSCSADGDQITQVILNLILNAEHAIRDSGIGDKVLVKTQNDLAKGTILIEIEDNGPGIPKALQSRIFEPFFTTKDVGDGTGIGLALSHRIIRSHNGQISLDKDFTAGTRFRIELPSNQNSEPLIKEVETVIHSSPKVARVLIIDDEIDVAELNAEILSRGGYDVDVANNAETGIAMMRHSDFDLVISDLNMPKTDGRGFYEMVLAEFPDMTGRVGFVTGDTMGQASQNFLKEANRPYLEKPASPKELRAFVAEILEQTEVSQ